LNKFFSLEKKKMSTYGKSPIDYGNGDIVIEKLWSHHLYPNCYFGRNHGLPYQIAYTRHGTEIFYVKKGYLRGKICERIDHNIRMDDANSGVIEKYKGNLYEFLHFNGTIEKGTIGTQQIE